MKSQLKEISEKTYETKGRMFKMDLTLDVAENIIEFVGSFVDIDSIEKNFSLKALIQAATKKGLIRGIIDRVLIEVADDGEVFERKDEDKQNFGKADLAFVSEVVADFLSLSKSLTAPFLQFLMGQEIVKEAIQTVTSAKTEKTKPLSTGQNWNGESSKD